jgi:hypothetical protein
MDGQLEPAAAAAMLAPHQTAGFCDGYWHGAPGMEQVRVL